METWLFILVSLSFLTAGVFMFVPRHISFVVFLFMNWIVFFLVPFIRHHLDASAYGPGLGWPWVVVFSAFFVPLVLFYHFFSARHVPRSPADNIHVRQRGTLVYCLACLLFAVAFVTVVASNGLFFMRIGHSALARMIISMGFVEHAILRVFIELLPLLLPANMLLFRIIRLRVLEKLFLGVYVLVGWIYILMNSRFDAMIVLLVLYILLVSVQPPKRSLFGGLIRFGAVIVLLVLLVSFGRMAIFTDKEDRGTAGESVFAQSQWLDRVDGMSMIGDIHHGAAGKGFMWGAAWENAIMLNYYFLFDKQKYSEIKLGLKTNPKVLIAEKYRGVQISDTPSTFLDDLYANFSIMGLLLGALTLAYVLSRASLVIRDSNLGSIMFFVWAWAVTRALYLDNEFLSMLLAFFKFLPVVVVFAVFYPAKTDRQPGSLPAANPGGAGGPPC